MGNEVGFFGLSFKLGFRPFSFPSAQTEQNRNCTDNGTVSHFVHRSDFPLGLSIHSNRNTACTVNRKACQNASLKYRTPVVTAATAAAQLDPVGGIGVRTEANAE
jgi:hypothetical protein